MNAWDRTDPGDDLTGRTRHRWHSDPQARPDRADGHRLGTAAPRHDPPRDAGRSHPHRHPGAAVIREGTMQMARHPLPWHLGWGFLCGRTLLGWFPCTICHESHQLRQLLKEKP